MKWKKNPQKKISIRCIEGHSDHRVGVRFPITKGKTPKALEEMASKMRCTVDELYYYHHKYPGYYMFWLNTFRIFCPCSSSMRKIFRELQIPLVWNRSGRITVTHKPVEGTAVGIVGPAKNMSLFDWTGDDSFDKPELEFARCTRPHTSDRIFFRCSVKRFPTAKEGPFETDVFYNMFDNYTGVDPSFKARRDSGQLETRTGLITLFTNSGPVTPSVAYDMNDHDSEFNHFLTYASCYMFPKTQCGAPDCVQKSNRHCLYVLPISSTKEEGAADEIMSQQVEKLYVFPACSEACMRALDKVYMTFLEPIVAAAMDRDETVDPKDRFRFRSYICSNCGKDSSKWCPCGKAYCDIRCQRTDYPAHKSVCSARKKKAATTEQ